MRESSTYQLILEEGAIEEIKKILSRQGRKRFGPPSESIAAALNSVGDLERLERMTERVLDAATWQELLDTP
jgi:hypothetical protein